MIRWVVVNTYTKEIKIVNGATAAADEIGISLNCFYMNMYPQKQKHTVVYNNFVAMRYWYYHNKGFTRDMICKGVFPYVKPRYYY